MRRGLLDGWTRRRRARRAPAGNAAAAIAGLLLAAGACHAQLPTARLDGVWPLGGQAGRECEITLAGADLDDVCALHFSHPGVTAAHVEGLKFVVTIEGGAPSGVHEVRAAGRHGISAPAVFVVGTLPEIVEPANNRTADTAAALTLPVTVNGVADGEASDFFKVALRRGEVLHIDCAAQRIDSPLNAVLSVRDPAGIEIHTARRTLDRDVLTEFTAATDGEHLIEVRDATWRGGPGFVYRLTISTDGTHAAALPVPVPLAGAVVPPQPGDAVAEVEPNDSPAAAQPVVVPGEIDGLLDRDWFAFTAEATGPLVVEVLSHRLGVASDPMMVVHQVTRDEGGKRGAEQMRQVGEFDDTLAPHGTERFRLGTRDPAGRLDVEAGATYRIFVSDRFNSGGRYRLVLRTPKLDFQVLVMPESPANDANALMRWSPMLRRGGSTALSVAVIRHDGFDEPVVVSAAGLPAGVSMAECIVPAGCSAGLVVLHASADAAAWSGALDLAAHAGGCSRPVREVTPRWSVGDAGNERIDLRLTAGGPMLAVSEDGGVPMRVEPAGAAEFETSLGATLQVPVKFVRGPGHKGIKGEWEAALTGLPGQRAWQPAKPAGDASEATLSLALTRRDGNQFVPGTWIVYAAARSTVHWQPDESAPARDVRDTSFSAPILVRIEPSPVAVEMAGALEVARGGTIEVPVGLQRRFGFAEAVEVRFSAPAETRGLKAAAVTVAKEAVDGVLTLECAGDAAPGRHLCAIETVCRWNGEELTTRRDIAIEVTP